MFRVEQAGWPRRTATLGPATQRRLGAVLATSPGRTRRYLRLLAAYCAAGARLPLGVQKAFAAEEGVTPTVYSQAWRHLPYHLADAAVRQALRDTGLVDGPDHPLWLLAVQQEHPRDWAQADRDGFPAGHDYWLLGVEPRAATPAWRRERDARASRIVAELPRRVWASLPPRPGHRPRAEHPWWLLG